MGAENHESRFAGAFRLEGDLAIPKGAQGAAFAAPWEGQAFAIAVKLHEEKLIAWPEFVEYLGAEIARPGAAPDGSDYYANWLNACEKLLADKALLGADEIAQRCAEIVESRRHHHKPDKR